MSDEKLQIIIPEGANKRDALSTGLRAIVEAIGRFAPDKVSHGFLGGEFGYGAVYENDIFAMCPDWQDAECDCGHAEEAERWHEKNPHAQTCFQIELRRRFGEYDETSGYNAADEACRAPGAMETHTEETEYMGLRGTTTWTKRTPQGESAHQAWKLAYDGHEKARTRLTNELYDERALPHSPYQWHCDCGVDLKAKTFFAGHDHAKTCALLRPNFFHKRSGFEVRWYKWIGRDTKTNSVRVNLRTIFAECLHSIPQEPT